MEISQTADHALRVLLSLGELGPASPADLTRRLGLARSVVQRLTATLSARRFIVRASSGEYALGPTISELARAAGPSLHAVAAAALNDLASTIGETAILTVRTGDDAIVQAVSVSRRHLVQVEYPVGFRHPLVIGAPGRAILLACSPPVRARVIANADDPDGLGRSLEASERSGYVVSYDELRQGLHGIAMPLVGSGLEASLSVAVPATRADSLLDHVPALREAVRQIERDMRQLAQ